MSSVVRLCGLFTSYNGGNLVATMRDEIYKSQPSTVRPNYVFLNDYVANSEHFDYAFAPWWSPETTEAQRQQYEQRVQRLCAAANVSTPKELLTSSIIGLPARLANDWTARVHPAISMSKRRGADAATARKREEDHRRAENAAKLERDAMLKSAFDEDDDEEEVVVAVGSVVSRRRLRSDKESAPQKRRRVTTTREEWVSAGGGGGSFIPSPAVAAPAPTSTK